MTVISNEEIIDIPDVIKYLEFKDPDGNKLTFLEFRLFVKSGGVKSSITLRDSKLNKLFKVVEFFYPVR